MSVCRPQRVCILCPYYQAVEVAVAERLRGVFCARTRLVDLAGSERNYETTRHSRAMHLESADINVALMSLKVRAGHTNDAVDSQSPLQRVGQHTMLEF